MTRDPRAAELLRLAEKAIVGLTRQRVDIPVGYAFLVADIRAYLDEPQGELFARLMDAVDDVLSEWASRGGISGVANARAEMAEACGELQKEFSAVAP